VKNFEDPLFVMMVTQQGMIKKTGLSEFGNPRKSGIGAIGLGKGDRLIDVRLTDGTQDIVIGTREGIAIRFHESEVRPMGRGASGVRAIRLEKADKVVGAVVLRRNGTTILVATEGGYGKRSETAEYRVSHRGGKGIITVKTADKTGKMVAIREVLETDDVVIVTGNGIVIRQHASEIRIAGRNTQGVRLIRLDQGDTISDVAAVPSEGEEPPVGEKEGPEEKVQVGLFDGEEKSGGKTAKGKEEKKPPEKEKPVKLEARGKTAPKPKEKPRASKHRRK